MKFLSIFSLINFLTFSIVDGDGGGNDDASIIDPVLNNEDAPTETGNPVDDVLAEIGLDDGAKDKQADADQKLASTEEADAAAKKAAEETEAAEAAKKVAEQGITDEDLAPLNSKNQATNERFRKVTEGYKAEKDRAMALEGEVTRYRESFDALKQLGFADAEAAQDLVQFADYRNIIVSGNEQAFKDVISAQIKQFEQLHGKKISISASGLDDYPDLKEKVTNLELDEEIALEVARTRNLQNRAQRENQQRNQNQQQIQQTHQQVQSAVADVEALQAYWSKNDPDFQAVLPHLQAKMEEIGKNFHPSQWASLIQLQYTSIKEALIASGANKQANNLPLRGNGNMTGKPAPRTPEEAVLAELGLDGD